MPLILFHKFTPPFLKRDYLDAMPKDQHVVFYLISKLSKAYFKKIVFFYKIHETVMQSKAFHAV